MTDDPRVRWLRALKAIAELDGDSMSDAADAVDIARDALTAQGEPGEDRTDCTCGHVSGEGYHLQAYNDCPVHGDPAQEPREGGGEPSQGFYAESIPVTFRDCHGDEHDVEAVGHLTRDGVTYWIVRVPPEEHGVLVATDVDGREWWDGYMLIVGDHMLTTESVRRLRTALHKLEGGDDGNHD